MRWWSRLGGRTYVRITPSFPPFFLQWLGPINAAFTAFVALLMCVMRRAGVEPGDVAVVVRRWVVIKRRAALPWNGWVVGLGSALGGVCRRRRWRWWVLASGWSSVVIIDGGGGS